MHSIYQGCSLWSWKHSLRIHPMQRFCWHVSLWKRTLGKSQQCTCQYAQDIYQSCVQFQHLLPCYFLNQQNIDKNNNGNQHSVRNVLLRTNTFQLASQLRQKQTLIHEPQCYLGFPPVSTPTQHSRSPTSTILRLLSTLTHMSCDVYLQVSLLWTV